MNCDTCGSRLALIEIAEAKDTGFQECRDCGMTRRKAGQTCAWTYLEADEVWLTACGTEWHFEDGKPGEYGVKFCPACGKPLGLSEEVVSKKPSVINGCIVFENPELPDAQ